MKESKFWVWFIPLFILICFGVYNLLLFANNIKPGQDSAKVVSNVKDDYEALNEEFVKVEINKNNSYYKATVEEIKNALESDSLIFFATPKDDVSRKVLSIINNAVEQTSIDKIYYYDTEYIDDDFNNYLKDKLKTSVLPGTLITVAKGKITKIYYPNSINNSKELTIEQQSKLKKEYQSILDNIIEVCDESC